MVPALGVFRWVQGLTELGDLHRQLFKPTSEFRGLIDGQADNVLTSSPKVMDLNPLLLDHEGLVHHSPSK
jgi:hypothetical protein